MNATAARKMTTNQEIAASKQSRISWLRDEVKRISNTTLRGVFSKDEDRDFWVARVRKLNAELSALEEQVKPACIAKKA